MAVVRFSTELKDGIIDNAKALFSARIETLQKSSPPVLEEIIQKVLEPYMPHINNLPGEFFYWNTDVMLNRIGTTAYSVIQRLSKSYPVPRTKIKTPSGVHIDSGYRIDLWLPDTEEFAPYAEQFAQWQAGIDALTEQRDEFVSGVRKVIEAHATLAPALKAWPPLWDLVPEAYKQRHRKVVERTKSEEAKVDVDLTKLTTTVVASKLAK